MKPMHLRMWVVLCCLVLGGGLLAQDATPTLEPTAIPSLSRVGFLDDTALGTASPNDPGPDGTSRFASIFNNLGYQPVTLDLERPIPDDIHVLVLIRPRARLPLNQAAMLYAFLQQGNTLMIAADPNGYAGVNGEGERDLLTLIFGDDYGVQLRDTFLIQAWNSQQSLEIQDLSVAMLLAESDATTFHPITQPLSNYDLPVSVWGGRSLNVEPFGWDSFGGALLFTESAYGETSKNLFRDENPDPLTVNIGVDAQGRLPLAAFGINGTTNSRILLFGDSELFQNQYGLDFDATTLLPQNIGNYLLAERSAAWLVSLPPIQYPALVSGYAWIAIDGQAGEWEALDLFPVNDPPLDSPAESLDVSRVGAVVNRHYLYLVVETFAPPPQDAQLQVTVTLPDGSTRSVLASAESVQSTGGLADEDTLFDAAYTMGQVVEARLPLRALGYPLGELSVCLVMPDATQDCLDTPITPNDSGLLDPAPLRLTRLPLAVVRTSGTVNIREVPNSGGAIVDTVGNNVLLAVRGRNTGGDWLAIRTGGYDGWINRSLVFSNGDVELLPVIEG